MLEHCPFCAAVAADIVEVDEVTCQAVIADVDHSTPSPAAKEGREAAPWITGNR